MFRQKKEEERNLKKQRNPLAQFVIGMVMLAAGLYWFLSNVSVSTYFGLSLWGFRFGAGLVAVSYTHLDTFDEETLTTIEKFFDNNLNVAETARQLVVHRNTLVYRLEKLQKTTGLDIRGFEDAMTFKIALMVASYMKYLDRLSN